MVFPSGEKCGLVVWPWKLVSRRAVPPARSTIHILFAYANAICVALTVGVRSMRVVLFAPVLAPARIRTRIRIVFGMNVSLHLTRYNSGHANPRRGNIFRRPVRPASQNLQHRE